MKNKNSVHKICFVLPKTYSVIDPKIVEKVGGAERQVYLLGLELATLENVEVHYLVADFGQPKTVFIKGLTFHRSFSFQDSKVVIASKLFKTIKHIDASHYILRAADIGVLIAMTMIKLLRGRHEIIYMLAHDYEADFAKLATVVGKVNSLAMNFAYRIADKITAQSEQQKNTFESNRNIAVSKIINNIFTANASHHNLTDFEPKNIVLWVARAEKWKNAHLFFDLAKQFPDKQFVMVCSKSKNADYWKQLHLAAQQIDNLTFNGFTPYSEVVELYKKARIFVLTSDAEGFANTMLEAISYRTAVLSWKVDPDLIFSERNVGICAGENWEYFTSSFSTLMSSDAEYKKITENALEYICKHHNPSVIVKDFLELIESK